MKKTASIALIISVLLLGVNVCVFGEETEDSLDLSQYQDRMLELGLPTIDLVTYLKIRRSKLSKAETMRKLCPCWRSGPNRQIG